VQGAFHARAIVRVKIANPDRDVFDVLLDYRPVEKHILSIHEPGSGLAAQVHNDLQQVIKIVSLPNGFCQLRGKDLEHRFKVVSYMMRFNHKVLVLILLSS